MTMTHHDYLPERYTTTFGGHPPVLTVRAGDTIATSTVDATGHDRSGSAVAPDGNPLTGPFAIENAMPGDTIAVHVLALRPNRSTGWSTPALAPHVIDSGASSGPIEEEFMQWRLDLQEWRARPDETVAGLEGLSIELDPMLGCLGVAPPGQQSISSLTSARHGGNMDYRGIRVGTTCYFPVFEPGALLYLGDGHALQGHGEINGSGVETSLDVELRVDLQPGSTRNWPGGEDDDRLFTIGNARPLEDALRHATTEMLHWIMRDYAVDRVAAETFMGMVVEYEIANVFDPAYSVVCSVPKRSLALLGHTTDTIHTRHASSRRSAPPPTHTIGEHGR